MAPNPKTPKSARKTTKRLANPESDAPAQPSTPKPTVSTPGVSTRSRATPKAPEMTSARKSKRIAAKQSIDIESTPSAPTTTPKSTRKAPTTTPRAKSTKAATKKSASERASIKPVPTISKPTPKTPSKKSKRIAAMQISEPKENDQADEILPVSDPQPVKQTPAKKSEKLVPEHPKDTEQTASHPTNTSPSTPKIKSANKSKKTKKNETVEDIPMESPKSARKSPDSAPDNNSKQQDEPVNTSAQKSTPRSTGKLKKITPKKSVEKPVKSPKSAHRTPESKPSTGKKPKKATKVHTEQHDMETTPAHSSKMDSDSTPKTSSVKRSKKRRAEPFLSDSVTLNTPTHFEKSVAEAPSSKKIKKSKRSPGRFDLEAAEAESLKKSAQKAKDSADSVDGKNNTGDSATPDVTFHKQMTKAKADLLGESPLSNLVSQKSVDTEAEQVLKARLNESEKDSVKKKEFSEDEDMLMLDVNAEPPSKKEWTDGEGLDEEEKKLREKETRKIKRKVRELRSRGKLPQEEDNIETGVMYLGHLPHGFYEREIRGYFSQFGRVTRVRMSRSKKTNRSRGYAFVEFRNKDVASIAAESMDGYLMHGRSLVAKFVPAEKVHEDTFKGCNKTFKNIPWSSAHRQQMILHARDPIKVAKRARSAAKRTSARQARLAEQGLNYEFPTVLDVEPSS